MMVEIRRDEDCPAAPICEVLGNAYNHCFTGGRALAGAQHCLVSLVLLLGKQQGLWTREVEERVAEKRRMGFGLGGAASADTPEGV